MQTQIIKFVIFLTIRIGVVCVSIPNQIEDDFHSKTNLPCISKRLTLTAIKLRVEEDLRKVNTLAY